MEIARGCGFFVQECTSAGFAGGVTGTEGDMDGRNLLVMAEEIAVTTATEFTDYGERLEIHWRPV